MIENEELREIISDMMRTFIEAVDELTALLDSGRKQAFDQVASDMTAGLQQVEMAVRPYAEKEKNIQLPEVCICAVDSLNRIRLYSSVDEDRARMKLEFELSMILRIGYLQFRYWGCAWPDKERIEKFRREEVKQEFIWNPRAVEAAVTGNYKYDLSINVGGYNKLEYTMQCVESLLSNLPVGIKYEIILINHGSTDGTMEYFEKIRPDKQIDISVNGAVPGYPYASMEGKYCITIGNDTIITPHAIDNLYQCIKENDRIGWVVPSTPNVSNLQTITANYSDTDSLYAFAEKNNRLDILREEQRVRLCNPITAFKASTQIKLMQELYCELYCTQHSTSFPDDKMSLWYRRNGYKLILAKDVYCHHFGSITLKDSNSSQFFEEGRRTFEENFGIDPWGTGFCYDPELFDKLSCREETPVTIAGINCGIGSNPLKVKEALKEEKGNFDATVINYISDPRYIEDLKGVSETVECFRDEKELFGRMGTQKFHYILMEEGIDRHPAPVVLSNKLTAQLAPGGRLCIKFGNRKGMEAVLRQKKKKITRAGSWVILTK